MKSFTSFTTIVALLASTTCAATVTIETTQCLQAHPLEKFEIELGKVVAKELPAVCGLKITSASVDVRSISCRAFKDTAGQDPGSAIFTFATPALIGTNPRQIKSIRCDVVGGTGPNNENTTATNAPNPSATNGGFSSRNSTISVPTLSTRLPTGTPTGAQTSLPTGAAGKMGWSIGAVIAAGIIYLV